MGNCLKTKKVINSPIEVHDFLLCIRPLDLIVFRGADGVSSLIRSLEKYTCGNDGASHVEIAINRKWCPQIRPATGNLADENRLYSWGSTMSGDLNDGVNDVESGGAKFGVQIRVLEDLIVKYLENPGANVGVCHLINNPTIKRKGELSQEYTLRSIKLKTDLYNAYNTLNGRTYDANPFALLGSMFPVLRPLREMSLDAMATVCDAKKWLFCSEFAAELYITIGVINDETDGKKDGKTLNPSDVLPVDFIGGETDKDGIQVAMCEYPPVWIKPI
jgi:hypothetical protein